MDIKIGDKFKCINSDAIYHKLGETYVITGEVYDDYNGYYILTLNNQNTYVSPTLLKKSFVKVSGTVDLMFFIRTSIENNKQLGENLKKNCIDYVTKLELEKFKHEQQTENIEPTIRVDRYEQSK